MALSDGRVTKGSPVLTERSCGDHDSSRPGGRPWLHANPAPERPAPLDRKPHPRRPSPAARAALHRRAADRRRPRSPAARRGPGSRPVHHVFGGRDRRGGGRLPAGRRPLRPLRVHLRASGRRGGESGGPPASACGHHRLRWRVSDLPLARDPGTRAADRRDRARRGGTDLRRCCSARSRTAATFERSRDWPCARGRRRRRR